MPDKGRILRFILPLFIALVVVLYQRGTAPKIVNEAGRTARLGMNPQQELALGAQAYRQVLSESRTVTSGPGRWRSAMRPPKGITSARARPAGNSAMPACEGV